MKIVVNEKSGIFNETQKHWIELAALKANGR